jgi:integrase/recombinase XerD
MSALAPLLQGFFTDKLLRQRQASPNTVAAYRDTCRLLLEFAWRRTGIQPTQLDLSDLDASLITAFLQHLETDRANTVTTRNARLAAIHSLFRYAALRAPEHANQISRILGIPPKRCDRAVVSFLTAAEIDALLAAPDRATWLGRRDHALLLLACQTGLRVSELTVTFPRFGGGRIIGIRRSSGALRGAGLPLRARRCDGAPARRRCQAWCA